MYAGMLCFPQRLQRRVHISPHGPAQRLHGAAGDGAGHRFHCPPVSGGGGREPRFDHIDPQPFQLAGKFHLLLDSQAHAGGLFSVPHRGVCDLNGSYFHKSAPCDCLKI